MSSLSATPSTPNKNNQIIFGAGDVKSATPDIVLFDSDDIPVETIVDLFFEDIGGQELINISRSDTINGQPLHYNPIKNLSNIQQQYNPQNIISLQQTSDKYFQNFAIKMNNTIPIISGEAEDLNVYLDPSTGDIVVDVINLEIDERVEIQVAVDGTIYEAEL